MHSFQGYKQRAVGPALLVFAMIVAVTLAMLWPQPSSGAEQSYQQPTATLTPALPPPITPTTAPPTPIPPSVRVCPHIVNKVPASALNAAIANPGRVGGYNQPRDPGKHVGPYNPRRMFLSIHAYSKPYHPLFNSLEFKVGCP